VTAIRDSIRRFHVLAVERRGWDGTTLATMTIVAAAYLLWQATGLGGSTNNTLINNTVFIPFFGVGVLFALRAASFAADDLRTRRAWRFIAAAYACYWLGDIIWLVLENVLHREPFPSVADVPYLAFYPFLFLGLMQFPHSTRGSGEARRLMLDTATAFVGSAMLIWYFVIRPVAIANGSDIVTTIVAVAYPVSDLVLVLGLLTVVFRGTDSRFLPVLSMLGAGIGVTVAADLLFAYLSVEGTLNSGGPSYMLYVFADLLFILAPYWYRRTHVSAVGQEHRLTMRRAPVNLLPYLAVAVGYGLLLIVARDLWRERLGGLIGGAVLLTLLVVARQILALRDKARGEARFRSLVQNATDIVCVVDQHGTFAYVSPSIERVLGYDPDALRDHTAVQYVHPEDLKRVRRQWLEALGQSAQHLMFEIRVRNRAGEWEVMEVLTTNRLDDPSIQGLVINARQVTERKHLEAQLRHQAFHDALTGLPNRAQFTEQVERSLVEISRRDAAVAILFLDLDGFKLINDSLGHAAGDAILRIVAERLVCTVRPEDRTARFGGDEFAVLVSVSCPEQALAAADRLRSALGEPVFLDGREIVISVSIGVALAGAASSPIEAEELFRRADIAMYQAKYAGKDRVVLYDATLHIDSLPRLELEADLRRAVAGREFEVYYQPEVDLVTGNVVGVEALVRWLHPTRGLLSPEEFITLAEDTGLIVPLGRQVLETACRDWRRWQQAWDSRPPLQMSVNLSPRQLADPALVADIRRVLIENEMDPSLLWLELTEGTVMVDTPTTRSTLVALQTLGVRLALDDFGTGYSSLSHLSQIPVGMLKVDRSFVAALDQGGPAPAVIQAVTTLAGTFGMQVVAEGVETAAHLEQVRNLGCNWGQGYYFGGPMPADALLETLRQQRDVDTPTFAA